jgi:hypothetical protein
MKSMNQTLKNSLSRIHPSTLIMLTAALLLIVMLLWSPAAAGTSQAEETPPPAATEGTDSATPQPTPIPQEWVDNREQTTGIIAGAVILAVILVGGTLHTIAQNKNQKL